jgi:hypothetical protein
MCFINPKHNSVINIGTRSPHRRPIHATRQKYHIEIRIATSKGFRLRIKDTQTKNGRKYKRGLDTLSKIKFEPQIITDNIKNIFGTSNYQKILVVWDVENEEVIKTAKEVYGIEIWKLPNILNEMMEKTGPKSYRNDILRAVQLTSKMKVNPHLDHFYC